MTDEKQQTEKVSVPIAKQAALVAVHEPDQLKPTAGVLVLQWLSYAFWGWLVASLVWLVYVVTATFLASETVEDVAPYALAAVIVLLPIAFVTDLFYRRYEQQKKIGAATVIMIIHAVIFALSSIGFLIAAVFTGIRLLVDVSSSGTEFLIVSIITLLSAAVLFAITFFRTLNPLKGKKIGIIYSFTVLGVSIALIIAAIAGPIAQSIAARDDKRIEQSLRDVKITIDSYARENEELPDSIESLDYSDEQARGLVEDGLVTYKKDENVSSTFKIEVNPSTGSYTKAQLLRMMRYQLCVTYKLADSSSSRSYSRLSGGYSTSLLTYGHPAGEVCYKLIPSATSQDYDY